MNHRIITYLFLGFMLLFTIPICAQQDSLNVNIDSTMSLSPTDERQKYSFKLFNQQKGHSPLKAVTLSALLPGTGQAYNKKYWKIPIIYAGLGGMGYAVYFNNSEYQRFRKAYLYRVDNDETTIDEFSNTALQSRDLKLIRDDYRKQLELSYIGLFFVYTLNLADAFVDAHLFEFDVNDNLSFNLTPTYLRNYNNAFVPAIGVRCHFKQKNK